MELVDLYVDGVAFYSGSTATDLKYGWCNLRGLGAALAGRAFNTSVEIVTFYYLNGPLQPIITASYGEPNRKRLYMGALRQEAGPTMIQYAYQAETPHPKDSAFALVIAAGRDEMSPLEAAVRARYLGAVALAVPTKLSEGGVHRQNAILTDTDLEASYLGDLVCGPNEQYRWNEYVASKKDAGLVSDCCKDVQNVTQGFFENQLKNCPDFKLAEQIKRKLRERVGWELSGSKLGRGLAQACRDFITEKMIAATWARLAAEEGIRQISTGRYAQSGPRLHRVEGTESFERQILNLEARDPVAAELARRKISDFCAGRGQTGLSLHRMERSKNSGLWSLYVNRDFRIIFRYASGIFTPSFIGHHAEADRWVKR
jgi:hypothetical protein